ALQSNELFGRSLEAISLSTGPAIFDFQITALGPPQFLKALFESRGFGLTLGIARGKSHQHANTPHPVNLLRACRKRPRDHRAAKQANELPTPHLPPLWLGPAIL